MVQNKTNNNLVKNFVSNSLVLIGVLSLLIILLAVYYSVFGIKLFERYEIGYYFYIICIIGVLFHFNSLMGTIYRVKNRLFELAFSQSVVPILIFFSMFLAKGKTLLPILLYMILLGNVATLILFIGNKKIPWDGRLSIKGSIEVLNKGFYLFIYNMCFFFIVLSTRTLISYFYEIEEFGYFTFSYTLANAVLLLLQALSVVIFPKVIDKLNSKNREDVKNITNILNTNYVTLSYGLMFLALIIFPVFINYIPKYQGTLKVLNLIAVTVLLYTNSFGYASHLMAQNQERRLSIISLFSLCLNIAISFALILVFKVSYEYVIISTLISYFVFSYSCAKFSNQIIGEKNSASYVLLEFFPIRLLIPYVIAVIIIGWNLEFFIFLPLLVFIMSNVRELKQIIKTIKIIITRPNIVDIEE
jgi:O-antigen/teichoic acid export membrane protein